MAQCPGLTTARRPPRKPGTPLKVAWFSYFPVEWLPGAPDELKRVPRLHPATWQRVFWEQIKDVEDLSLDIIAVRGSFQRSLDFELGNTRFHCIKTPGGFRAATLYWLDTLLISKKLKKIRPDVVHAWGTEFGAASIASRLPYPSLVTMQGILTWNATLFPLNRQMQISHFLEPRALRKSRVATAESNFAISYLGSRYPGLKLIQIEHAPDPVFSQVTRTPQCDPIRFICLGGYNYAKGADVVIEALNTLFGTFEFELFWIGSVEAEFANSLRQKTRPELWNRITFKQNLSSAEIAEEFKSATMMIHASRADNSPNAVKEAVVAGLPVIASRIGGIPDYVKEEKNGLLFKTGDVSSLMQALQMAIKSPLLCKGRVDLSTLDWARKYLSVETMTEKFLQGYELALSEP